MTELHTIALSSAVESNFNPRKHFHSNKLEELASSIRANGVLQPILVRRLPPSRLQDTSHLQPRPEYEIVAGARRYRASRIAGVASIPAIVCTMDDATAMEAAILENLQRSDLSELEEAEGFEALMQHAQLSAEQLGEKIGKSRSYVYARTKLLDLSLECKEALRQGQLDASRALLLARIPDGKLQLKALTYATTVQGYPAELPSLRRLQDWLKANVMLRLEEAIFKLTDTRLIERAGSCADCPKRTGANPDLFADVASADICTDPPCFHAKEEAHRASLMQKAQARGLRIVQDKEALELMKSNPYSHLPDGYSLLTAPRADLCEEGDRVPTLAQLLGKDAPEPILFIHPRTQEASELVPTAQAQAVLLAKGLLQATAHRAAAVEDLEDELKRLKDRAKRDTDRAIQQAIHQATANAIRQSTATQAQQLLSGDVLRAWLLCELDICGEDDMARICNYTFADGVDEMDALTAHLQRMGDTDLLRTTALAMLDREGGVFGRQQTPIQDALAKLLGINTQALQRTAQASVKAEYTQRLKDVQQKLQEQTPAAASEGTPAKEAKPQRHGSQPTKKSTPKLQPEQALAGIAAAMQGLDSTPASESASPPMADFEVGMAVRVVTDVNKLGTFVKKFAGRSGTITKREPGGGYWHVSVKPGGLHMFARDQLESA